LGSSCASSRAGVRAATTTTTPSSRRCRARARRRHRQHRLPHHRQVHRHRQVLLHCHRCRHRPHRYRLHPFRRLHRLPRKRSLSNVEDWFVAVGLIATAFAAAPSLVASRSAALAATRRHDHRRCHLQRRHQRRGRSGNRSKSLPLFPVKSPASKIESRPHTRAQRAHVKYIMELDATAAPRLCLDPCLWQQCLAHKSANFDTRFVLHVHYGKHAVSNLIFPAQHLSPST